MISRSTAGLICFAAYLACLPLANWLIGNVGTYCVPNGPCLIPLWPTEIMTPSGVLMIGLALVLRDLVQRYLGVGIALFAIMVGALISAFIAPPALVLASVLSFFLSELIDFLIYTWLIRERKSLVIAVALSSFWGLVVDSMTFLWVAFGSLDFLTGQMLGKALMVVVALPFIYLLRRHEGTFIRDLRRTRDTQQSAIVTRGKGPLGLD